jgi:hypothetical protein
MPPICPLFGSLLMTAVRYVTASASAVTAAVAISCTLSDEPCAPQAFEAGPSTPAPTAAASAACLRIVARVCLGVDVWARTLSRTWTSSAAV